jgi:hypothetical protein
MSPGEAERIGELLVEEGAITREELSRALADAKLGGGALAALLDGASHVRRAELAAFLAADFHVPAVEDLRRLELSDAAAKLVPEALAAKHELVPVARIGDILCVAKANYFNRAAVQELRRTTGLKVKVLQADETQVRAAFEKVYKGRKGDLPAPGAKRETAARPAPQQAQSGEEVAAFEAVPLITPGRDEFVEVSPAARPAATALAARPSAAAAVNEAVEEVIEIMEALKIPSQEYQTALKDPRTRLMIEFDDLFHAGKAVPPARLT